MTGGAREREAKFDVADDFEMPALDDVRQRSSKQLVATYWDTADLRLLRWGHTLRHRKGSVASDEGWTLKLAGPPAKRLESVLDRDELTAPGPGTAPPPGC